VIHVIGTGPSAGIRPDAAVPGQVVVDMHGEQNGAIYEEVTLGRSDIAPVSLLAEDRADVLEGRINGKYCDHSSHLHPRHTAADAGPGQGLWSSLWAATRSMTPGIPGLGSGTTRDARCR